MELIQKLFRPAFSLLETRDRSRVTLLTVLLLLQGLLDVISVASVAPLALLIIQPDVLMKFPFLMALYDTLGFLEVRSFSIFMLSSIILFLFIKHFISHFIGNYKTKLIFSIAEKLAKGVIYNFCHISYPGYYDLKSSNELTRIINLPTLFAHNVLLPLTVLITEGFILLMLMGILIYYNISAMLWLSVVLVPAIVFYLMNRNRITAINDTIKTKYPRVLEEFMALYDNLVEIKLYQKENIYSRHVEETHQEVLNSQALKTKLFLNSTRLLETSALLCLCLLIGYFILLGS